MRAASRSTPLVLPVDELLIVTPHSARPDTVVITVSGEVDMFTGPLLRDRLHEQVHRSGPDLVVDLTGVRYFGAAGLAVLMEVRMMTLFAGIGFRVVAATRVVLLPLRLTGLDNVFDVSPDLSQALTPAVPARHR